MAKAPRPRPQFKHVNKDVRGHVQLGGTFVSFDVEGKVIAKGELTGDEMAAMAHINELLRRLRTGKIITYDFDPLAFADADNRLVSCEWLASGNLKLNMEDDQQTPRAVQKRYDHAYTVAEAMHKHRTFTCSLALYMMLPRRRAPREIVVDELEADEKILLASEADIEAGRTKVGEEIAQRLAVDAEQEATDGVSE